MYKSLQLSPMIPSFNIRVTVDFFTGTLGFSVVRDDDSYVILSKDNAMVHIQRAGDIGEMSIYLAVDDIDALWVDIEDKVRGLKVRAPFDRDYGMREIHIIIPETKTLLFIGQVIKNKNTSS